MPDNAFIESFNGKFRAECLNAHWFLGLEDAREKLEAWRRDQRATTAQRDREQTPGCVALRSRRSQPARSETGRKLCARMVQSWVAPQLAACST